MKEPRILVPLMMPFRADETIDHDALKRLVRYELDEGADGIYAGGSSAEAIADRSERAGERRRLGSVRPSP